VLHIYHYLASYGAAAIVEFPGILYRSGKEAEIRKYLVQNENAIDSIIQLPDNLFFGTSISTCIITLRKNKLNDTGIFFVDASKEFVKKGDKNSLSDENISHIIETIRHKKEIENFSKLVPQSEIIKNNFNLSVNSYITKENTKEKVDIKVLNQKIRDIVKRNDFLRKEIDAIVAELEEGEDE
jgi:type I restriction-modification system, M subunit